MGAMCVCVCVCVSCDEISLFKIAKKRNTTPSCGVSQCRTTR
jgi:hypothetical protein